MIVSIACVVQWVVWVAIVQIKLWNSAVFGFRLQVGVEWFAVSLNMRFICH